TQEPGKNRPGRIKYVIWSDVFLCPECNADLIFWDRAVDLKAQKFKDSYTCAGCGASLEKGDTAHAQEASADHVLGKVRHRAKQVPVLICYTLAGAKRKLFKK